MSSQTTHNIRFLDCNGYPPSEEELDEESEDGILAVSEKDFVVELVGHVRIRTGAAGTGEATSVRYIWEFIEYRYQAGLFGLIKELPGAIKKEIRHREENSKPYKRFISQIQTLGYQILADAELAEDIIDFGLDNFLRSNGTFKL